MGKAADSCGGNDPVAGNDEGEGIVSAGLSDCPCGALGGFGQIPVGSGLSAGNCGYCGPDSLAEKASAGGQGQGKGGVGIVQVAGQLNNCFLGEGILCGNEWMVRREKNDFLNTFGRGHDSHSTEWGGHYGGVMPAIRGACGACGHA